MTSEYCRVVIGTRIQTKVKRSFSDAARQAAIRWPTGQVVRHIYQCEHCSWWHLTKRTSPTKNTKQAILRKLEELER